MRRLSAIEAFTPAFEHTRSMLRPFSVRLWLKLGLVALLAEMGSQFIVPPVGNSGQSAVTHSPGIGASPDGVSPHLFIILAIIGVCILLFGLAFLYFGSRMQFVLMDIVATRSRIVGPSWRRHGPKTWPWVGLKIVSFLALVTIVGIILVAPLIHLFRSIPANPPQQLSPSFFGSFILIFVTILIAVLVIIAIIWTLRDFVLPFIVFDNARIGTALKSAAALICLEPPAVLFYFLLKFAVSMAAGIAIELCIFAAVLIIAIPGGLIGGAIWMTLRHAGAFGTAIMYLSFSLLGIAALIALLTALICLIGAALIFYQSYALYFLGGRIPRLGDLLEPPPPLTEVQQLPLTTS